MIIIGIDPGIAITGFAIMDNENNALKLMDYGCIKTEKNIPSNVRLKQIADDLEILLKKWEPNLASIEKLFFKKNIKTAMQVSQARGVILEKLTEKNVSIYEYTPLEIKTSLCGYGKADKKMVQQMLKLVLSLNSAPRQDDAADAIAAAICLANSLPLQERILCA